MRRGVALLITVGFITILMTLIGYMFAISNKSFERVNSVEINNQNAIIISDIKTLFDTYALELKDSDQLSMFLLGIPLFYDEKSGLSLHIEIESLSNKININSILINNQVDEHIERFLLNLSETHNVIDVSFLIALILDTIDSDSISRKALSEISQDDYRFSNSKIYDQKHFNKIINHYIEITKDSNILKIPWHKLIFLVREKNTLLIVTEWARS